VTNQLEREKMDYSQLKTEPVLQIVHLSDMHLVHPSFKHSNETRVLRRLLKRFEKLQNVLPYRYLPFWDSILESANNARTILESGFDGHDEDSIKELIAWFRDRVRTDEAWSKTPTWLLDTGDQSTNGDDQSLDYGLGMIAKFSEALGGAPYLRIHGNHDAWPGKHPLISSKSTIDTHKKKLRREHFIADYPCFSQLSHTIPGTNSSIDVYSLNSVVHTWLKNGIARGEIKEDKYWEHSDKPREDIQLQALEALAVEKIANFGSRSLRLVLSHHPINIEYPHILSGLGERLIGLNNASKISSELACRRKSLDNQSLAHLVLSGHTHHLYPAIGRCSNAVINSEEEYLHQLVIGTAAKLNSKTGQDIENSDPSTITEFNNLYTNQVEILRLSRPIERNEATENLIAVDRIIAGRVMNVGPWAVINRGMPKELFPERFWIKF